MVKDTKTKGLNTMKTVYTLRQEIKAQFGECDNWPVEIKKIMKDHMADNNRAEDQHRARIADIPFAQRQMSKAFQSSKTTLDLELNVVENLSAMLLQEALWGIR